MRTIRKILFWAHLGAGVAGGVVIFIMCASGLLLAFEGAILLRADGHRAPRAADSGARASLDKMLASAAEKRPGNTASGAIIRADLSWPVAITVGREGTLLFDAVSGEFLGEGAQRLRAAYRIITDWHRWLGRPESSRAAGRALTGVCNLAFLFLILSGLFLWMPRHWTWRSVCSASVINLKLSGRARDWNWHNAIGLWCAFPLAVIVLSGVIMSYPWANGLLFRLAGETAATRRGEPPGRGVGSNGVRPEMVGLDRAFASVAKKFPNWSVIRARLNPSGGTVTFSVDPPNGLPQQRSQITVQLGNGEVVRRELYAEQTRGRRWRGLARFLHTGEAAGVVGQLLAALASAGGSVLVWTGLALAWRRVVGRQKSSGAEQQ